MTEREFYFGGQPLISNFATDFRGFGQARGRKPRLHLVFGKQNHGSS